MGYLKDMHRFGTAVVLTTALALAACGKSLIRDDYMGKALLQPDKVPRPVQYNAYGDPILEDNGLEAFDIAIPPYHWRK